MDPSMQASYPSNPSVQGSMGSPYVGGYPSDGYSPHGYTSDYTNKMANIKAMGNGMLPNDSYGHYGGRQVMHDMTYPAAGMGQYPPSYERSYPGQHPSMGMPPSSMGGGYRVPIGHHDGGMGQWSGSPQHPGMATQQGPVEWGHPHPHQSVQHVISAHAQDQFAAHPHNWPPGNQYPGYSGHHGDPYRTPTVQQGHVLQPSSQNDPLMANREGRYLSYQQGANPAMNSHNTVGTPTHRSLQSAGSSSNLLYNQELPPNAVAPPPYTNQTGEMPGRHWGGGALPAMQHSAASRSTGMSRPEVGGNSQGLTADNVKVEDSVDKEEDSEIVKDLLSDASNGNDETVANAAGGSTPSPLLSPTILPQGSITNLRNTHQMTPPQPEQQRTLTSPTQHPYAETPGGFERTNSRSLSTSSDAEQAQRGSVQAGQTDPSDSNVSTPLQQLSDGRLSSSYHDLHQPSSVGTPQSSYPEEQMPQGAQPPQQQQKWAPSIQQQQQQQSLPQTVEGERRIPSGTPPLQTEGVKSAPLTDPPQQPGSGMSSYAMSAGSGVVPQFKQYPHASPSWNSYKEWAGGHSIYPQPGYSAGPIPNSGYPPQHRQPYESEYSPASYGRHSFVVPHPTGHPLQHAGMEGAPGSHPPQTYSPHYPHPSMQMHHYQQQQQRNMAMFPSQMGRQLHHQQEIAAYHHHQQQQAQRQQQQLAMQRYAASGYVHPQNRVGMPSMPTGYHPSSMQGHHFSMSSPTSAASVDRDSLLKSTLMQKQQQQVAQQESWGRGSPQRPPSTGSSVSQPPTPQPPMSRTRSNDKPHYTPPEGKVVAATPQVAKSDAAAREGAGKRGRPHDWSTTVEGVNPQLMKFRRMMPQDCGQVEHWRLLMCLKSGIQSEATWAIDTLNVMLADDRTAMYFSMQAHQSLLSAIVEHFYRCLTEIFGEVFNEDSNGSKEIDSNGSLSTTGSSTGAGKDVADSCEANQYEMKASPRTVAQSSNNACLGPLGQAMCTDVPDIDGCLEDSSFSHIDVDYSSRHCNFPLHEQFCSNLDEMRQRALQVGSYHRIDEQHPFSLRTRRWRRKKSCSESSDSSEAGMEVSASAGEAGKQAYFALTTSPSPWEEQEVCSKVESPLWTIPPDKEALQQRCLCLSNILRSLSFIPGNDTEFSKHPRLLRLMGVLLLLHHIHILQIPKKTSTFGEEDDPENTDCEKDACTDESSCSSDYWWWDCLRGLRESVFIILSNISGQLDLSVYPESITLPLVDGLLHWAVCPASEAVEQFSPSALAFNLSPQRMVVEALAKISIADVNVDYILATPPLARQETLYTHLVKFLGLKDQPVMKQFSLVLLSNLAQGDEAASFLIGHQKMVISHLVECLETVEGLARRKLLPTSSVPQNSFEDDPIMSVAMLRRAAVTLHCLAKVPSNQKCFLECLDRILYLSTSDYLEPSVSGIIMDLLFELGKRSPTSSS